MRIAQVAPLVESIPPERYGGTERVISTLTEELVRRGHDVTLFASGDSRTEARLAPMSEQAFWRSGPQLHPEIPRLHTMAMLSDVYRRADEFDVIHSHTSHYTFPFAQASGHTTVVTLHGLLNIDYVRWIHARLRGTPLVSVSMNQRTPLADLGVNWVGCVPSGIPIDSYKFNASPAGDYLVFVGRIAPYKGPHLAVEIARAAGLPLKVGAAIHPVEQQFWEEKIRPLFDENDVEFLGEVSDEQKSELFGGALATLFPSDWPEPFGLVIAESLACGTPVIALDRGAVRELINDGVHGFACPDVPSMVSAVARVADISREACRERALRFSPAQMAADYERIYECIAMPGSASPSKPEIAR
jgi:glycosyltransferase involved in cell wall biosynthesis